MPDKYPHNPMHPHHAHIHYHHACHIPLPCPVPHHGDMYHLHTWRVPLSYLTWTTTTPTCTHHHTWHGPPPCPTYTHHHTWHVQSPSLTCTITMPVMYHHQVWHVYVSSGDHAYEVSSLLTVVSPHPYCFPLEDTLNLFRFPYRSQGKLIVATSLKNMSVNLSHCLQILMKSGTLPHPRSVTGC